MSNIKTLVTDENVYEFIKTFANTEQKIQDSHEIIKIMKEVSGFEPKMWGSSIIGFGSYHYKSERSRQEGDWPLIGFSPRKAAISLYIYSGMKEHEHLLENLGKFKMGKACIYIKKLSDINTEQFKLIIKETIEFLNNRYQKH